MAAAHATEDPRLQQVRVLVLVHQDVVVLAGDARGQRLRLFEQQRPEQQQVVVVHQVAVALARRVVGEDARDVGRVVHEPREILVEDLLDLLLGVDVAGVDVVERFLLGEPLGLLGVAECGARELHQILGVALVHDREVRRQAAGGAVLAERAVAHAVKRAAVHPRRGRAHQPLGAGEHFLSGAAGEAEQEDAFGRGAGVDQVGDAVDQRARLARAGAGDDQQGPVAVRRGGVLLLVELGPEVARGGRDLAGTGGIDAGHGPSVTGAASFISSMRCGTC